MKKTTILFLFFSVFVFTNVNAQSIDLGMLDKASKLLSTGDQMGSSKLLGQVAMQVPKEKKAAKGDFGSKIVNQVGSLSSLIPALEKGTGNVSAVQKIINTIKMLVGANNLSNLVGGGNLIGKTDQLTSNLNLLQTGLGMMDGGGLGLSKVAKSLTKVTKKLPKLDKAGKGGEKAQKSIVKKLGGSLNLLKGLI